MAVDVAVCTGCQGSGKCSRCLGEGHREGNIPGPTVNPERTHSGSSASRRPCPQCMGSGVCQTCHGKKRA